MATILVMDDDAPIRGLLSTALQSTGYTVIEAPNGHEGLRLYRQNPADLVIVDILMPELNGPDTIMALIREFLDIKVIAISGAFSEDYLKKTARLLGARQTLRKPFGMEELLRAVRYELAH
jgi:Response regulator containing CheY-like receiver, AAA-type ATPase, and DNA-binding domains